jgi:AcrR family transcriptional regulator
MTAEKVDRRVRRTKGLLRGALLSLIREKGYERITVQEIIDRADVGRSTFYAHFRDKEDLLVYGLEELRDAFTAPPPGGRERPPGSPTLAVFEHFAEYNDVWKVMSGKRGGETFIRYMHEFLAGMFRDQFTAQAPPGTTQVPVEALAEFAASTLIGLGMRWWQLGALPLSPREVDRIYRRLTEPAIEAGLGPRAESAGQTVAKNTRRHQQES